MFLKTADLVSANPKTEIRDRLLVWEAQVEQLWSGSTVNRWKQLWCEASAEGRAVPSAASAGARPCTRDTNQEKQGDRRDCDTSKILCSWPAVRKNMAKVEKY